MGTPRLVSSSVRESQRGWKKTAQALYRCAYSESMSDVSLEEGDILPFDTSTVGTLFDTTYEIVSAEQVQDRSGPDKLVAVAGYTEVYRQSAANSAFWSELNGTRRVAQETTEFIELEARFSATTAMSALDWPVPGDLASAITGQSASQFGTNFGADLVDAEPQAIAVTIEEAPTVLKRHCTVRFRSYFKYHTAHGSWMEVRGTRRISADTNDNRQWTIDFVGATSLSPPTNGMSYASVTNSTQVLHGTTGTFDTAVVVQVSQVVKVTPVKSMVTCVFRENYLDTTVA